MEGPSDALLDDEIEEIKDIVTTRISGKISCQSPNPLWLRICKVQYNLRSVNEMAYEPVVLSIGPYHHGKSHLQKLEDLKLRYLQSLLERKNETDANRYVEAMRKMEESVRVCYADPISLDRDEFVMMMVLDGCFIVELFIKFRSYMKQLERNEDDLLLIENMEQPDDFILGKDWLLKSIQRDLLLCESQLPYSVLLKLFEMVAPPDEEDNLHRHAVAFFLTILVGPLSKLTFKRTDVLRIDFNHLLDLIYSGWRPPLHPGAYFVGQLLSKLEPIFKFSATELREAGIKFKAKYFTPPSEIKYSNGVLEIPSLAIDHHTESVFRNLLAFEQHHQQSTYSYMTDYIRFMDILIDSEKDVQILRRCNIILHGLGDDEAVCTMFNKFSENFIFRSSGSCYVEVLVKLDNHCKQRRHAWMASLRHKYFNSPWALISVHAAAFAILLTLTQTVYAIISYHKKQ